MKRFLKVWADAMIGAAVIALVIAALVMIVWLLTYTFMTVYLTCLGYGHVIAVTITSIVAFLLITFMFAVGFSLNTKD